MAKRLTDTEKWRKSFIKKLPAKYKLFWFYITDDCDHAGIWHVDFDVASLRIGEEFNLDETIEIFGDKIRIFDEGEKWFIPSFIEFQYGELNEKNRVHLSVIKELNKYNLFKNKPLESPLEGSKDKEKDKDKDKEQVQIPENLINESALIPSMMKIWKEKNTAYFEDKEKDFHALRKIATDLATILNIEVSTLFLNKVSQDAIKLRWGELVTFIHEESFFRTYSLFQVEKHFQSILLRKDKPLTNGKKTIDVSIARQLEEQRAEAILNS